MIIRRSYFTVDTREIPDTARIVSAKFSASIQNSAYKAHDEFSYIALTPAWQESSERLEDSDIGKIGSERFALIPIASLPADTRREWELNGSGINHISKTGLSKFGLREGHDLENNPVNISGWCGRAWEQNVACIRTSESGAETAPYLEVIYVCNEIATALTVLPTPATDPVVLDFFVAGFSNEPDRRENSVLSAAALAPELSIAIPFLTAPAPPPPIPPQPITKRFYSSSADGWVETAPYPSSWKIQRNCAVGRGPNFTVPYTVASVDSYSFNNGYLIIRRSFFSFDTSSIPDRAEIISAKFSAMIQDAAYRADDKYSYIALTPAWQGNTDKLEDADIAKTGTESFASIPIKELAANNRREWTLNSSGLNSISKIGWTKFSLREGHDIENNPVNVQNWSYGSWKYRNSVCIYTSEAGEESAPYLEITYMSE